jgi:diguanylate cyclase (GGDEF)-like protein
VLYLSIAVASGFYFSSSASALSVFFFVSQLIIVIDLLFTLIYNHFYDENTGFYSRNSYLIKSKHFPFKYNLGIISIDNYDKLQKTFGYKKQKILTNLIAEVIQELTSEETVFRYAPDQFVVLYKDKDNKESFAHLDNIRRIIAGVSFGWSSKQQPIKLTVSCSLAEKKRSDAGALEVLVRADKAMRKTLKFTHNVTSKG